ncbi:MAG: hypothetical protein M5U28_26445 [Sandaracinaceae bacterium]|nr:hypothetical protein [Sandaracinaceae bacterium]
MVVDVWPGPGVVVEEGRDPEVAAGRLVAVVEGRHHGERRAFLAVLEAEEERRLDHVGAALGVLDPEEREEAPVLGVALLHAPEEGREGEALVLAAPVDGQERRDERVVVVPVAAGEEEGCDAEVEAVRRLVRPDRRHDPGVVSLAAIPPEDGEEDVPLRRPALEIVGRNQELGRRRRDAVVEEGKERDGLVGPLTRVEERGRMSENSCSPVAGGW